MSKTKAKQRLWNYSMRFSTRRISYAAGIPFSEASVVKACVSALSREERSGGKAYELCREPLNPKHTKAKQRL